MNASDPSADTDAAAAVRKARQLIEAHARELAALVEGARQAIHDGLPDNPAAPDWSPRPIATQTTAASAPENPPV